MSEKIGLIAGKSKFPLIFAQSARKQGIEVVAAAHRGETDPDLEGLVSDLEWVSVGQLGRIIKYFQKAGVTRAVMAGGITKGRLFTHLRPDLRALKLLSRMKHVGDDGILRGVAAELEGEGITIVSPAPYLTDLLAPAGVLSRRRPSADQMRDIDFGADLAREIGRLDIGQCVVVRRQAVLAVEAIDGTDATIRRGGLLAGEKAVVVKVSKPNQDLRFDVPAVGLGTIEIMQEVKASALALEAGKTLIFERTEMLHLADRLKIAVIGLTFDS